MIDLFSLVQDQVAVFLLVFVRVSGIFFLTPVYGSRNVPGHVKVALGLAVTYILYPMVYQPGIPIPEQWLPYLFLVASEFVAGMIIGFVSSLVFTSIQMCGQILDTQIGFGIVNVIDPQSGNQVPLVGNFLYILAIMVFLALNGHHVVLGALVASFKLIPMTGVIFNAAISQFVVGLMKGIFLIAIQISLPVLASLLLIDISLGILSRTMPQMNIFIVGVPAKIFAGIFVLSLVLPFYIFFLEKAFNGMYKNVYDVLSIFG
ncbi:flagellar biosynthetic protein FliR [Azotosporobacter soli]|uniref:flagellar biosynthetic protein FliR n=1 Tax=Azotosporobacter soli TaxID=3055040 RepID=UPI0031FE8425